MKQLDVDLCGEILTFKIMLKVTGNIFFPSYFLPVVLDFWPEGFLRLIECFLTKSFSIKQISQHEKRADF
jgi:hypothetical protein